MDYPNDENPNVVMIKRIFVRWFEIDQSQTDERGFNMLFRHEKALARPRLLNHAIEHIFLGLNKFGVECALAHQALEVGSTGQICSMNALRIGDVLIYWNGVCGWLDVAQQYFPQLDRADFHLMLKETQTTSWQGAKVSEKLSDIIRHEQSVGQRQDILSEVSVGSDSRSVARKLVL